VAKTRSIRLAPRFIAELRHQIQWIAADNPVAAARAEGRVRVAVRRLSRFPHLGRTGRIDGTRELSVPNTRFIIAYRVTDNTIDVAALLHAAQQWPTHL